MVGAADLIGRAAFAAVQVPAGIVTALVGVPVSIALILRNQERRQLSGSGKVIIGIELISAILRRDNINQNAVAE